MCKKSKIIIGTDSIPESPRSMGRSSFGVTAEKNGQQINLNYNWIAPMWVNNNDGFRDEVRHNQGTINLEDIFGKDGFEFIFESAFSKVLVGFEKGERIVVRQSKTLWNAHFPVIFLLEGEEVGEKIPSLTDYAKKIQDN